MREFFGYTILHFGWAFFGQECDCGCGLHFNRLARWFYKYDETFDDDTSGVHWYVGDFFAAIGTYVVDTNHFEYFDEGAL